KDGISFLLSGITHKHAGQEHRRARGEDRPSLPPVANHDAEGISQTRWDHEDEDHLQKIRDWRRIFEWMRRVRVEEAASVRSEHFYRFLGCHRALRKRLRGAFKRLKVRIMVEILDHALRAEEQRGQQRDRTK